MFIFRPFLIKIFIFILIWIIAIDFLSSPSSAAETGQISIYPANYDSNSPNTRAWFTLELSPGQSFSSEVTIQNKSDHDKKLEIYPVDATITMDGTFALQNKGSTKDLGGWIKLSQKTINLKAGEVLKIPFTIEIPKSAAVGDHSAGIAVEEVGNGSSNLKLISRVGTRVYVKIAGQESEKIKIAKLTIGDLSTLNQIKFNIKNEGNTNQNIKLKYFILGAQGAASTSDDKEYTLLPGKEIVVEKDAFLPIYASLQVEYGKNNNLKETQKSFSPAFYALVFISLVFVSFSGWRKYKNLR